MERGRERRPFFGLRRYLRPRCLLGAPPPLPLIATSSLLPYTGEEEGTVHRARPLIPGTWAENTQVFLRDSKRETEGRQPERGGGEGKRKLTAERGTHETVARNSVGSLNGLAPQERRATCCTELALLRRRAKNPRDWTLVSRASGISAPAPAGPHPEKPWLQIQ